MGNMTTPKDDIIEEIHRGREQYSAQFDCNLERIFADLLNREKNNPAPRANLQAVQPKTVEKILACLPSPGQHV